MTCYPLLPGALQRGAPVLLDGGREAPQRGVRLEHARGGIRTRTGFPPRDFKSLVYTGSTTRASI